MCKACPQNCAVNHHVSSVKGVSWASTPKKWRAAITNGGVQSHLGYFDDEHSVAAAYKDADNNLQRLTVSKNEPSQLLVPEHLGSAVKNAITTVAQPRISMSIPKCSVPSVQSISNLSTGFLLSSTLGITHEQHSNSLFNFSPLCLLFPPAVSKGATNSLGRPMGNVVSKNKPSQLLTPTHLDSAVKNVVTAVVQPRISTLIPKCGVSIVQSISNLTTGCLLSSTPRITPESHSNSPRNSSPSYLLVTLAVSSADISPFSEALMALQRTAKQKKQETRWIPSPKTAALIVATGTVKMVCAFYIYSPTPRNAQSDAPGI